MGAQGRSDRNLTYVAAAILAGAALVSATLIVAPALTRTQTLVSTTTTTSTATTTTLSTVTTTSSLFNAYGFQFMKGSGICTASGAVVPCWGEPAYVFNCSPPPFTEPDETCDQVVTTGVFAYGGYGISITSYHNQSEPWANCAYQFGFGSEVGAHCVLLNSSAFILGEPAPSGALSSSSAASIQVSAASVSRLDPQTGLNLTLDLSASANPYPTVNVTAYDVNTLGNANNLTMTADWAARGFEGCPDDLVSYLLYQGNYDLGNFTQGTPIRQSSGIGLCAGDISYYIFSPLSMQATVYFAPGPFYSKPLPANASLSASLLGFWGTDPANPGGAYFVFPAGTYTVVAEDQWGNVVLSHFTVQS